MLRFLGPGFNFNPGLFISALCGQDTLDDLVLFSYDLNRPDSFELFEEIDLLKEIFKSTDKLCQTPSPSPKQQFIWRTKNI